MTTKKRPTGAADPKPVKLTIYVDDATRRALRKRAIDEGVSATALVERLIHEFLRTKGGR